MPFSKSSFLESLASDHIRRKNYVLELNAVLTWEVVERLLLRHAGTPRDKSESSHVLTCGTSTDA